MVTKQLMASFAVDDLKKAKDFYEQILGFQVAEKGAGITHHLNISQPGGGIIIEVYPKPDFTPATFTVLNIFVEDIDEAVDELTAKGVEFEKYEEFRQDEKGIARSADPTDGPHSAWLKDPAGNIFAILEAI